MHVQHGSRIRLEQGLEGGRAIAHGPDVLVVVVDVLSFTTCVSVAADRGVVVIPVPWGDGRAEETARRYDAVLAGPRSGGGVSLSPASIRRAELGPRLVLPSPNGAAVAAALGESHPVLAASFRNVRAAAAACTRHLARSAASTVAIVAAGERWDDGSLRAAPEDVWAAGAVVEAVRRDDLCSMEALGAADAFRTALERGLPLEDLTSGRELVEQGFAEDVAIAAELDASAVVPRLVRGAFVA